MPDELREHLRYPEDLFRIQTTVWGRYHIDGAQNFYEQAGGWEVAQAPDTSATGSQVTTTTNAQGETSVARERRIDPQYLLMRLPDEQEEDFLILRSFVPSAGDSERKELTAFMVAKSDPDDYGEIEVFEMQTGNIPGPAIVGSNISSNERVASEITLLNQNGSRAEYGNLLLIPIEDSILYVRPLYTKADGTTAVPLLRRVIVAYGDEVVMRDTLREALIEIFGDAPDTLEQPGGGDDGEEPEPGDGEPGDEEPPPDDEASVNELLVQAEAKFDDAEEALRQGDLGEYQSLIAEAQELISQALEASGGAPSTTTAPTTTAPPDEA
jgi:uncharacterized membrane protein (UPF0182 family)